MMIFGAAEPVLISKSILPLPPNQWVEIGC
jgi:hypothetical protein